MSNIYKPVIYKKDILDIDYLRLKKMGIKCLLIDIDNTIAKTTCSYVSKDIEDLFESLKKDFKIIILTNAIFIRARKFAEILDVPYYAFSCKPFRMNYKKIMTRYGYKESEMAAIGDQLYTDIKGANKLNIMSILVDPLAKREGILTKVNRLKERSLIRRTKLLKRGEYYE